MGICGKVDPEGNHPEDEKHDLQMELESSRYDEVCVSATEEKKTTLMPQALPSATTDLAFHAHGVRNDLTKKIPLNLANYFIKFPPLLYPKTVRF